MRWTHHPDFRSLTDLEKRVAGAAAEGWDNQAICLKLGLRQGQVNHALTTVYRKVGITTNGENYHPRARLTNFIVRAELMRPQVPLS
jgi:DNA-binding NarL/FixJ family response regulator